MTRTVPTPVHIRLTYASCGRSPYVATFRETLTDLDRSHCSWKKRLPTQSTVRRLTDPWVQSFSPEPANEAGGRKPCSWWWPTTRFIGPISPACDWYVQYLFVGANPSVLNRHRRRLQPWRYRLAIYPLSDLSNQLSPLSPSGPVRSQIIQITFTNWTGEGTSPKSHEWEPQLDFYRNLSSKHSMS
jgi:hypothetical protein